MLTSFQPKQLMNKQKRNDRLFVISNSFRIPGVYCVNPLANPYWIGALNIKDSVSSHFKTILDIIIYVFASKNFQQFLELFKFALK